MKKLLVIDGNSILNRAYNAIHILTTSDGLPTNAVLGFTNILLKHLDELKPDYAVAAFDLPTPTFRHKKYVNYKANRHGMPEELAVQLPYAKECALKLGFKVMVKEGYEADDILGTLAQYSGSELTAFILSGDRDLLQLINNSTNVLLTTNSNTVMYTREKFSLEYGIDPTAYVDVKALMGDSSDNIPGVVGIGEKTAFKLISAYGNLDEVYNSIDSNAKSIRQKLSVGKENAYLSQFLSKIDINVPLDCSLNDLQYKGYERDELIKLFNRLEFNALIKRLNLNSEIIRMNYSSITVDELIKLPRDFVYTVDLNDKTNTLYVCGDKMNASCEYRSMEDIRSFFEDKEFKLCVYDSKKMYRLLNSFGIKFANCVFDVMLAGYVINSSENSYDLGKLSGAYLGETYDETKNDKVQVTHKLFHTLRSGLEKGNQYRLYNDIELPLAEILVNMEQRGFKIDKPGLTKFSKKLSWLIEDHAVRIYDQAGCEFNINSPKQLGEVLFNTLELPSSRKSKNGNYTTDAEELGKLRPYHPIIDIILEYRQLTKLKTTYADGLIKVADSDGRVHTSFNQTVTATGRLSSTEPNLQNIPIRQPLGKELRTFFIADSSDYMLIDADYSQIELRLLADISGDAVMTEAFKNGDDIHTLTASQVFNIPPEIVTPELRKRAKAVNFGIVYGISDFSLGADIGVSKYQAGEYIRSYLEKYPKVDSYLKNVVKEAYENGYVTTKFGRRRYIPELKSSKVKLRNFGERVAMNSPIQGTAADVIKLAMINTEKSLRKADIDAHLILQVHDELIVESHKSCVEQASAILKHEMENIEGFSIPLSVEISVGENWYMK